ncbi:Fluoroacetate dehalogenase [uncultured Sphingopyxis sp.]|uniref:Fluoroacetate dehalogenase n=1 Tax=uncultured Sphingopyxis sp. TaxID=310581 RepID=A0A1Y5PNY9_9SPHN|nr:alpha/beta hydrolase [uncultured Sphingopyxis sp.]SBV31772.1 Fluoroacetate dehalogenase [uncultured Sphingopyxis sp.]
MAFDDFATKHVACGDVSIFARHGGEGPPLLLLHGYPQTHMMWRQVADRLASHFTIIAPDIRGYGRSTQPPEREGHAAYAKRLMAWDMIAVMRSFGHERFFVAGHDRGGRIAYRMALDYPGAIRKLSILDIIPTGEVWARADARFALGYWHWAFLAQPAPLPERLIGADPETFFFKEQFPGAADYLDPVGYRDYLACMENPAVIHAMCQDYRAGASYDRVLDQHEKGKVRIDIPLQILWGSRGALEQWYDVLAVWREWGSKVEGQPVEAGHFLAEENAAATGDALLDFFGR